jgi:GNAT superfamily N-acetyltransferase
MLMQRLIAEAKERGERRMLLEVIEQNTAGVRLYSGCGFRVIRRLVSYTGAGGANAHADLEEVDIRAAARMATCHGLPDLPWQISGESLAQLGLPHKAYRLDSAWAIISNPDAPRVAIRAVLVEPHARHHGQATRLLEAIMAQHAGKQWDVPAHCPEEIGGMFERVGLTRGSLAQLQMVAEWS